MKKVYGKVRINGNIKIGGSKNTSLPILAATVLLKNRVILSNIPKILDIDNMMESLTETGIIVTKKEEGFQFDSMGIYNPVFSNKYASKIRGSLYLMGSMLSRMGSVQLPYPGGCKIGYRGIDLHILMLTKLGVTFNLTDEYIEATCTKVIPQRLTLPYPSRGVTGNILLLTAISDGATLVTNPNTSPEIKSLISFLNVCGANIYYEDDVLIINGVKELRADTLPKYSIPGDKIEAATYLIAALLTNGEVTVTGIDTVNIKDLIDILSLMNVCFEYDMDSITVKKSNNLIGVDIITGLPPMLDPDYEPLLAVLLLTLKGKQRIIDSMNPGRHNNFIPELIKYGASIDVISETEALINKSTMTQSDEQLIGKDIRSTVALLLLGMSVSGVHEIKGWDQVNRGYEKLEYKLNSLGARIESFEEYDSEKNIV